MWDKDYNDNFSFEYSLGSFMEVFWCLLLPGGLLGLGLAALIRWIF